MLGAISAVSSVSRSGFQYRSIKGSVTDAANSRIFVVQAILRFQRVQEVERKPNVV